MLAAAFLQLRHARGDGIRGFATSAVLYHTAWGAGHQPNLSPLVGGGAASFPGTAQVWLRLAATFAQCDLE